MLHDEPALVWQSQGASGVYLIVEQNGPWDTIALLGTNLVSGNTIRVRTAATQAALTSAPALDRTISAFTGTPKASGPMVLFRLDAPVSQQFIRIDLISDGNPAGFVEVSNLVLGVAVEWAGPDAGAEIVYDNAAASYLRKFRTKPTWKINLSGITTAAYFAQWEDFLIDVGDRRGFLFVPIYNDAHMQKRSAYVSIASAPKTTINSSNDYTLELQVSTIQ
jgi:hypothetical protein